jgi:urease accessory protein
LLAAASCAASWALLLSAGIEGVLHPLATPAHVIALTGLALIAGRCHPAAYNCSSLSAGAVIVAALALGLAVGLGALALGAGETPAGDVLLAGATLCGLMAASGLPVRAVVAALLALMVGIAIGLDSPPDVIRLRDAVAALIGTFCGAGAALALMARVASVVARWRDGIALRVAGSWIAAMAVMALAVQWRA